MIVFNQLEGNNVQGIPQYETPVYNDKCGFKPGAQNDIFQDEANPSASQSSTSSTTVSFSSISTLSTVVRHVPTSPTSSMAAISASTSGILNASTSISKAQSSLNGCQTLTPVTVTETITSIVAATPHRTRH